MAKSNKKPAVFISGCDSGFGKILVEKLDALNKYLIFAGVFTEAGKALYSSRPNVVAVSLDVTSDDSVAAALDAVKSELQRRDAFFFGLVNNAGLLTQPGPSEWQDPKNYERMMAVNLYGVVRLTNTFMPLIRKNQGRIVILSSIASRVGLSHNAAYCASKYAVGGYIEVLRREMIPWKVRVIAIEPGVFGQTGLYADFQKGLDTTWKNLSQDRREDYGEKYYKVTRAALGYAVKGMSNGNPEDVPNAIIEALTTQKPLRRYRPGKDSAGIMRVLPLLPDHWVDAILTRPLGPAIFPAAIKDPGAGPELYRNDLTASVIVSSLAVLSTYGVYSLGRGLISRL